MAILYVIYVPYAYTLQYLNIMNVHMLTYEDDIILAAEFQSCEN